MASSDHSHSHHHAHGHPEVKTFTKAQVAEHTTPKSCWMVIHNKVYDVTRFLDEHPGGDIILDGAGRDATELFDTIHSNEARRTLSHYFIGNLEPEAQK